MVRNFRTKTQAVNYSKGVTRQSFGSSRPISKRIHRTKRGYSLYVRRR